LCERLAHAVAEHLLLEGIDNKDERATKATENAGDRAGEVAGGKDGERSSRPRVFYATVFNASQIDGIPPIERSEHKWEIAERAEQLIAALGVDVRYGGNRAFYAPEAEPNVIKVPERGQFHSAAGFYDTLLHEAAHWTGHSDRLDRDLTGRFGSESYAKEELRAEIAGAFISAELGIPRDTDNNAAYVASWIKVLKNDKNEIFRAATDAQRVSDFVFERALERVQGVEEARPDLSSLVTYTPGSNDIVESRDSSALLIPQTMTILGQSEDGARVFGRDGAMVVSVPATAFSGQPKVNDVIHLSVVDGKDRAEVAEAAIALEH
jgi:hypothetical protein